MTRDQLLLNIKRSRDKLAPTNIRRTQKTTAAAPRLSSHRVKAYKTLGFILRKLPICSDINIVFTHLESDLSPTTSCKDSHD